MSNLTDALIAAKLMGNGGSGGGSGLPEITRTESTVLETQTISFTVEGRDAYASLSIDGLEVGREYSVIYDGVTYSGLIAKESYDEIYIGNLAISGDTPDTDEPFIISTYNGETNINTNNTTPTHEVGISSTVCNPANGSILVVDNGEWKAVPSGGIGLISTEPVTLVESQTVSFADNEGLFVGDFPSGSPLLAGANYSVSWDGVVYTCTAYIRGEAIVVGDLALDPFTIEYLDGIMTASTQSTDATHLIEITGTIQTPSDGSALIVENGEWTVSPLGFIKTIDCESAASVTIQAGAIAEVRVRGIPTLHHAYAAIRIVKIAEGAIPLIVLDGAFSGAMAVFTVYNPTTESVYFGRNTKVSITGIMM